MNPPKVEVSTHELIVSAAVGAVFGLIGYFVTRKIQGAVEKIV